MNYPKVKYKKQKIFEISLIPDDKLNAIKLKIEKQNKSVKNLQEKLIQSIKNSKLECFNCKSQHKIGEIDYVQPYYYNYEAYCEGFEPDSNEGSFLCPQCESLNRFNDKELINNRFYFKSIVKDYCGVREY